VIARFLSLGMAASLLAVATAGSAGAAAGSIWQVVPSASPQPAQVTDSQLVSVSTAGAAEGWAAGTFSDKNAIEHPLLEHWAGSAFTRVTAPTPKGRQGGLAGVDELSPSDVWAVGDSAANGAGMGNIDNEPLIEHFNGTAWAIVKGPGLPAGSTGVLTAVGGTGPDDLWAVGYQLTAEDAQEFVLFEHFDGTKWQIASFPTQSSACDPTLADCFIDPRAVTAASSDDVWVVGSVLQPNPTANFTAHWNGTAWSVVPAPCLEGTNTATCSGNSINLNELTGVTALSGNDAWASGSEGNVNDMNFHIPYVLHWNGTDWSLVKTPNRGGEGSLLNGITALGTGDIWAVGQTQQLNGAITPLTEQFNGSTWSLVASPAPGGGSGRIPDDSLSGVTSPASGSVIAVGARDIPGQCCLRTLALKTTSG
jgi:hypothetical protein